jgi:hypothetical protein
MPRPTFGDDDDEILRSEADERDMTLEEHKADLDRRYAAWDAKEPYRKLLQEKLMEMSRLKRECVKLADEHGLSFSVSHNEYVSEGALALMIGEDGTYGDEGPSWEWHGWQASYC